VIARPRTGTNRTDRMGRCRRVDFSGHRDRHQPCHDKNVRSEVWYNYQVGNQEGFKAEKGITQMMNP